MKRKVLSILLTLALCLSLVPLTAVPVSAATVSNVIKSFDFETDPTVEGWTFVDADGDARSWVWSENTSQYSGNGYDGSECIVSRYHQSGDIDNWAISPAVDLSMYTAGDQLELSLYAKKNSDTYVEHFQIWAGTSADKDQMTCISGNEDIVPTSSYARYKADLSAFTGKEMVYVAIRHCNSFDQFNLLVDRVEICKLEEVVSVTEYDQWVGSERVTSANASDVFSDGKVSYDADSKTLTLNGYSYEGTGYQGGGTYPECGAIYSEISDLTLVVEGTNTVKETGGVSGHYCSNGLVATKGLTIKGSGTLNAIGGTPIPDTNGHGQSRGIRVIGTCTFDESFTGTVNATGSDLVNPMNTDVCHGLAADTLIVNGGALNATAGNNTGGQSLGIATVSATINGGTVTATGGIPASGYYSYGLGRADLTINGGTVTLIGDTSAFYYGNTLTFGPGVTAVASVNKDGAGASTYESSQLSSYKYIKTTYATPATTYPVYVGGVQVDETNASNVLGDGKVIYDPASNTLMLNNAIITGGSENTNNYGWGICYRGTDDFYIVANGNNIVQDANQRTYASYGIIIGEPSPVTYSTDAVNVTITVADGATLVAAGGKVNSHSENYEGIWGIYNKGSGSLTVNGGGTLIANASTDDNNIRKTMGLAAQDITIDGSCTINAVAGDSNMSVGILCGDLTLPESFTGTVNAASGKAPGTGYNYATYGIRATGDVSIGGGTVTASTGTRTGNNTAGDYAVGIFGENSLSITGGTVKASGDGVGLWCYQGTTSINKANVTAIGNNIAVNGLDLTSVTAEASTETGGTDLVKYDDSAYSTYKYVHTTPVTSNKVAEPVLPRATSFTDSMTIEITCETEDAEIYYTTGSAITLYTAPFVITETTTVEAHATKAGFEDSDAVTATYTKTTPSSGGGGGGATTYPVTPAEAENGKITVSPKNAAEGDKVTITVTPDEGYELDKLTVKDKDGNEIEVTEKDGKYTFTMPASEVSIEPAFKEAEDLPGDGFPFVDVPEDAYFRKPVEWAVEKDITSGVSEDKYGPELSCTRAQVVTFLWITCGSEDAGTETEFDDVDVNAYYDKAVAWAVEKGITAGTSEDEFSPEMIITRAQFVTMLWVAQGKPEADGEMPFTDVPEDAYYAKAVAWAYANDITAGKSADSFAPDDPCTRGQIMTFLYNAYGE